MGLVVADHDDVELSAAGGDRRGDLRAGLVLRQRDELNVDTGVLVEVTTLVIPGLNDQPSELGSLARFLSQRVSPDTPWHVSRFYPTNLLTGEPPTPVETLEKACEIGHKAGLKYIYKGNVQGDGREHTSCPSCDNLVINRWGFQVLENRLKGGKCPACGTVIEGVWTV